MTDQPRDSARAIIIKDDQLLVIYRFKSGREYYVLPGGGLEGEENFKQAVVREVKEETGIEVLPVKLVYELIQANGAKQEFWVCTYLGGQPNLAEGSVEKENQSENNRYNPQWLKIESLNEIDLLPPLIKKALISDLKDKDFVFKKIIEN